VLQLRRDSKLSLHEEFASETTAIGGAQHSTILGIIWESTVAKVLDVDVVAAARLC
jgi:hypothetical protein